MRALLLVAGAIWITGCASHGNDSVLSIAKRAQAPNDNGGASSDPHLEMVRRVKSEGYPQQPGFFVAERTSAMQKFPCLKCHDKKLEMLQRAQKGKKAAHWDVKLEHANKTVMDCSTCHLKEELESLATLNRTKVHLNHAYQVCAQCHSRQAADWAGGAHGKRLGGWAPPRVVSSCPACHNPHKPKLEPRLPVLAERRASR